MRDLWINNDLTIEVDKLRNVLFNTIDTTASISFTLYESDGATEVQGETWPKAMQSVGNGRYIQATNADMVLVEGSEYIGEFAVTGSAAEKANWSVPFVARVRDF